MNRKLLCLGFLLISSLALAAVKEGVQLPDQLKLGQQELLLNGLGVRKATFLKVKAYVGALYLEKKSQDPQAIMNSPTPKEVVMRFLRDISAGKLRGAWDESYEKNCVKNCERFKPDFEKLKSLMTDVKEKDQVELVFLPNETKVLLNGKERGVLPGGDFGKLVLSTWLGDHPPNEDLKEGMLGRAS